MHNTNLPWSVNLNLNNQHQNFIDLTLETPEAPSHSQQSQAPIHSFLAVSTNPLAVPCLPPPVNSLAVPCLPPPVNSLAVPCLPPPVNSLTAPYLPPPINSLTVPCLPQMAPQPRLTPSLQNLTFQHYATNQVSRNVQAQRMVPLSNTTSINPNNFSYNNRVNQQSGFGSGINASTTNIPYPPNFPWQNSTSQHSSFVQSNTRPNTPVSPPPQTLLNTNTPTHYPYTANNSTILNTKQPESHYRDSSNSSSYSSNISELFLLNSIRRQQAGYLDDNERLLFNLIKNRRLSRPEFQKNAKMLESFLMMRQNPYLKELVKLFINIGNNYPEEFFAESAHLMEKTKEQLISFANKKINGIECIEIECKRDGSMGEDCVDYAKLKSYYILVDIIANSRSTLKHFLKTLVTIEDPENGKKSLVELLSFFCINITYKGFTHKELTLLNLMDRDLVSIIRNSIKKAEKIEEASLRLAKAIQCPPQKNFTAAEDNQPPITTLCEPKEVRINSFEKVGLGVSTAIQSPPQKNFTAAIEGNQSPLTSLSQPKSVPVTKNKVAIEKKLLLNALETHWNSKTHIHTLLIKSLINSKGEWLFTCDYNDFLKIVEPFNKLIIERNEFHKCFEDFLSFFSFKIENIPENLIPTNEANLCDTINQWLVSTARNAYNVHVEEEYDELPDLIITEAAEAFFELKLKEYSARQMQEKSFIQEEISRRSIPCFLIAQNISSVRIEPLMASFNTEDSLIRLERDTSSSSLDVLKQHTNFSIEKGDITLEELNNLYGRSCHNGKISMLFLHQQPLVKISEVGAPKKNQPKAAIQHKRKSGDGMPSLFSSKKRRGETSALPASSQPILITSSNQEQTRHKALPTTPIQRKRISETAMPNFFIPKKRRVENNALPTANQPMSITPSNQGQVNIRIGKAPTPINEKTESHQTLSIAQPASIEQLTRSTPDPKNAITTQSRTTVTGIINTGGTFWEQINGEFTQKVKIRVEQRLQRISILEKKPIDYPILKDLREVENKSFPAFFDSLKDYQIAAFVRIMNCFQKGISPILALEVGLGKTFVYAECLAQMFVKEETASLVLVPKALLSQISENLTNYFETICAKAWQIGWKKTQYRASYIHDYSEHFSKLLNEKDSNLAPFLRALADIVKDGFFGLLCAKIKQNHALTPSQKMKIEQRLSKYLEGLYASFGKDKKNAETIVSTIDQALRNYVERQKINSNFINAVKAEDLFKGNVSALKITKISINNVESLISFLSLIGELLEIDPTRKADELNAYDDITLEKLKELSPKNIIITEDKGKELTLQIKDHKNLNKKILISTYTAIQEVPIEVIKNYPFACVICDEAQKIHNGKTKANLYLSTMARELKNTRWLAVTATPFENELSELWNILALTNPGKLLPAGHDELNRSFKDLVKRMLQKDIAEQNIDTLSSEVFTFFSYMENFRRHIVLPMVEYLTKENKQVIDNWQGRIPSIKNITTSIQSSEIIEYEKQLLLNGKKNFFTIDTKIKQALVGIFSGQFNCENPEVQEAIQAFEKNDTAIKDAYLNKAPVIKTLLEIKEIFTDKRKTIIITQHLAVAKIAKAALQNLYDVNPMQDNPNALQIAIYDGSLKTEERERSIREFKGYTAGPSILIILQEAGGCGLDLKEANTTILLSNNYNPAKEKQARGRNDRVGDAGEKTIWSISVEGLFMEAHYAAINNKKNNRRDFFWKNNSHDDLEQFKLFCNVLEAECYHVFLTNTKNVPESEERLKIISEILNKITNDAETSELKNCIAALAPKIEEKNTQNSIPSVAALQATSPSNELFQHKQTHEEGKFEVFPLPKEYQNNIEAYCVAFKAIASHKIHGKTIKEAIEELRRDPSLKEYTRQGVDKLKEKIGGNSSKLLELLEMLPTIKMTKNQNLNMGVYTFNSDKKEYTLEKQHNQEQQEMAFLYQPTSKPYIGKTHYDILIPR